MRIRRKVVSVVGLVVVVSIGLAGCGGEEPLANPGTPTPTVSAQPSSEPGPEKIGEMYKVVERDFVPQDTIDPAATTAFGDELARDAGVFAVSFGQATAEDTDLWFQMVNNNVKAKDLTADDYKNWGDYFTPLGKTKFLKQLGAAGGAYQGVGDFLIVPTLNKNTVWVMPGLRPSGVEEGEGEGKLLPSDSAKITKIGVGPVSELDPAKQTLVASFTDTHTYDYKYDGKWVAVRVSRDWVLTLAPTGVQGNPFMIQDWTVAPLKQVFVKAVGR